MGTVDENQPLEFIGSLRGGYAQSKCVAEKLVRAAGLRGLPVAIYRPGLVTADSETGAASPADLSTLLLRLCIDMKIAPALDDKVEMTPVDYVARAIVGLAQQPQSTGKTFHLVNPHAVPLRDIYRAVVAGGYDLREVPFNAWRGRAMLRGTQSQDQSFTALSHLLFLMAPLALATATEPNGSSALAMVLHPVTFGCEQTLSHLQPLGVSCPVVNVEHLQKQVLFLVRNKFVTPPPHAAQRSAVRPAEQDGRGSGIHARKETLPSLVPLRAAGSARPLFCVHGLGGHVAAFLPLAQTLAGDRPLFGLQAQGLEPGQEPHERIEEMAAWYVEEIRDLQPQGPYLLGGWSMGGQVALEAAQQLLAAGQEVALVVLFDTYLALKDFPEQGLDEQSALQRIAPQLNVSVAELKGLPLEQQWQRIAELANKGSGTGIAEIRRLAAACNAHLRALKGYELRPYAGPTVLFAAMGGRSAADPRWQTLFPRLCVEPVPGDHFTMLREPRVQELAERLGHFLQQSDENERTANQAGANAPWSARPQDSASGDERKSRP